MEMIKNFWDIVSVRYSELIVVGAIIVSAIIVLIGILKPVIFNRIPNKLVRKALLAFSNVFLSFAGTAIYFAVDGIDWQWYWIAAGATSASCILCYWLYENTCLRDLFDTVGRLTLHKVAELALVIFNSTEKKQIEDAMEKVSAEIKETTQKEIKKASKSLKKDKELENL